MKTTANFLKIILVIFLVSTFFNCKKDEEETVDNNTPEIQTATGDIMYIKSINESNDPVISFDYDDSHRLSKMTFYFGSTSPEFRCTYDDDKLTKGEVYYDNVLKFTYVYTYDNSGNLERCDFIDADPDNTDTLYWTFESNNGKIVSIVKHNNIGPVVKYELIYADDSVLKTIEYSFNNNNNWDMIGYTEYDCDNKNNPLYVTQIPFSPSIEEMVWFTNKNNILVKKYYDADGTLEDTFQSVYTYNDKSYPETVVQDGQTNTFTYY